MLEQIMKYGLWLIGCCCLLAIPNVLVQESNLAFYGFLLCACVWTILFTANIMSKTKGSIYYTPSSLLLFTILILSLSSTVLHHRATYVMLILWIIIGIYYQSVRQWFAQHKETAVIVCCNVLLLCLFLELLLGYYQWIEVLLNNTSLSGVRGTFDNAAGLVAATVILYACLLTLRSAVTGNRTKTITLNLITWSAVGLIIAIQSRIGLLAIIGCYWAHQKWTLSFLRKKGIRRYLFIFSAIIGGLALYFIKKDSADGRILIYRCTMELFTKSPFTGLGYGGFKAAYMQEQAAFFQTHPDSPFNRLADNIYTPMNEYLRFLVEYGIVTSAFLFLLVFYAWNMCRKSNNKVDNAVHNLLTGIFILSLCSYPITYPFVLWTVLTAVAWTFRNEKPLILIQSTLLRTFSLWGRALATGLAFLLTCRSLHFDMQWSKAFSTLQQGKACHAITMYESLYPEMSENPAFLYNYAVFCNEMQRYARSDSLLNAYKKYGYDTNVLLLEANNAMEREDYSRAESCLMNAHNCIPNRFIPLFYLMRLYRTTDNEEQAKKIALQIIRQPIKVPSEEVNWIREEARYYFQ